MIALNKFRQKLPVLEEIKRNVLHNKFPELDQVAFVCVQHLLYTTTNLLDVLVELGAKPSNIHIMGKSYSTSSHVAHWLAKQGYHYYPNLIQKGLGNFADYFRKDIEVMWQGVSQDLEKKDIRLVVVLDDGGSCLLNIPEHITRKYPLIAVEQTSSGLTNPLIDSLAFPIIEVASSAAKQLVEAPMIAEAVVKKINGILPSKETNLSYAVVGLGVIGQAITQQLVASYGHAIVYDKVMEKNKKFNDKLTIARNLQEVFQEADYIFGCAGEDITKEINLATAKKDQVFISCSSQDKEFLTLLRAIQTRYEKEAPGSVINVLGDVYCRLENRATLKILRGGFPINLDNSGQSVPPRDIQLTRGLLLGGVLQGILYADQKMHPLEPGRHMLHPSIQRLAVSSWRLTGSHHFFDSLLLDNFQDYKWVQQNSKGIYQECEYLDRFQPNILPEAMLETSAAF